LNIFDLESPQPPQPLPFLASLSHDRPWPRNNEAEMALLGSMMLAPADTMEAIGADMTESFYDPAHGQIYAAIKRLCDAGKRDQLDLIVLSDELERSGELEQVGGKTYLIELLTSSPTSANAAHHAEIVLGMSVRRKAIKHMSELMGRAFDMNEDTGELLAEVNLKMSALAQEHLLPSHRDSAVPIGETMMETVEYLEKLMEQDESAVGFSTGFTDLDRLRPLVPAEMYVIAARPSIGKTALGLNIACHTASEFGGGAVPTLIFSIEMSRLQLAVRAVSSQSRVATGLFRDGVVSPGRWQEVMETCAKLKDAPLFVDDTTRTVDDIIAVTRAMVRKYGIRVVVIDYLQLMRVKERMRSRTRENEVADMSAAIKGMAKDLDLCAVVLAQLNRGAEGADVVPKISHLRESGAIENDADVIVLLHRDRKEAESEAVVAKNRNGPVGTVPLVFDQETTQFRSRSRISDADIDCYTDPGSSAHMQKLRDSEGPI